jgi:hypothetical protein
MPSCSKFSPTRAWARKSFCNFFLIMKIQSRNFFPILFVCLAAVFDGTLFAGETVFAPHVFNAHIGGLFGTSYSVQLTNDVLVYSATKAGKLIDSAKIVPTDRQWGEFQEALNKLNIWEWRTNYINHTVVDGTQWSLEIKYANGSLKTFGSNSFPKSGGKPNNKPEFTDEFRNYLKAVQKIAGGKPFE